MPAVPTFAGAVVCAENANTVSKPCVLAYAKSVNKSRPARPLTGSGRGVLRAASVYGIWGWVGYAGLVSAGHAREWPGHPAVVRVAAVTMGTADRWYLLCGLHAHGRDCMAALEPVYCLVCASGLPWTVGHSFY